MTIKDENTKKSMEKIIEAYIEAIAKGYKSELISVDFNRGEFVYKIEGIPAERMGKFIEVFRWIKNAYE